MVNQRKQLLQVTFYNPESLQPNDPFHLTSVLQGGPSPNFFYDFPLFIILGHFLQFLKPLSPFIFKRFSK